MAGSNRRRARGEEQRQSGWGTDRKGDEGAWQIPQEKAAQALLHWPPEALEPVLFALQLPGINQDQGRALPRPNREDPVSCLVG